MQTYVALLRGINVSGQKSILMADLKGLFESLKFKDVRTYIQSGNVVYRERDGKAGRAGEAGRAGGSARKIEKAILKRFGFEVTVLVRTAEELAGILGNNPFGKSGLGEGDKVYISFLSAIPENALVKAQAPVSKDGDRWIFKGSEAYILCKHGFGKTVFSNGYLEKKLGVRATTRNLQTVAMLHVLASSPGK